MAIFGHGFLMPYLPLSFYHIKDCFKDNNTLTYMLTAFILLSHEQDYNVENLQLFKFTNLENLQIFPWKTYCESDN